MQQEQCSMRRQCFSLKGVGLSPSLCMSLRLKYEQGPQLIMMQVEHASAKGCSKQAASTVTPQPS